MCMHIAGSLRCAAKLTQYCKATTIFFKRNLQCYSQIKEILTTHDNELNIVFLNSCQYTNFL